jgi:hypothetical protein
MIGFFRNPKSDLLALFFILNEKNDIIMIQTYPKSKPVIFATFHPNNENPHPSILKNLIQYE